MKTVRDVFEAAALQYNNSSNNNKSLPRAQAIVENAMQMWADEQTEQLQITNLELTHQINKMNQVDTEAATLLRGFAVQCDHAEQLCKREEAQVSDFQSIFKGISEFLRHIAIALNPPKVKKDGHDPDRG